MKRKILSLLLGVAVLFGASSCAWVEDLVDKTERLLGKEPNTLVSCHLETVSETRVAIVVHDVEGSYELIDCMEILMEADKFTYEVSNGMITAINGKANTADFSGCWMLYTSDTELSNAEWGTIEYEGKTLGSAIVGAADLPVAEDQVYVWEYVTF